VGEILFARKKTQERPALERLMVTDGASQHRIMRLQGIEDRALSDWTFHWKGHLAPDMRQISQVKWKYYADRGHRSLPS
jgi:hypothetical protein